MQRLLRMAVLLPVFALLPVLAEAQNAKKSKTPPPANEPAKFDETPIRNKLLGNQYIEGKLTAFSIDGEEKFFSLQYIHTTKRANPEKLKQSQQELQKLANEYKQAVAQKNAQRAKEIQAQAAALQQNGGYDIDEHPIKFEYKSDKDIAIRTMLVPLGEDGKPKKLSPEETKKLKGDGSLPGNMATLKDIDLEQTVRIYLDKNKYKPAPAKTTSTKDKKDDKDKKDEAKEEATFYPAKMIVIVPPPMDKTTGASGNPFLK